MAGSVEAGPARILILVGGVGASPRVASRAMRILGIDPGSRVLGYGCIDVDVRPQEGGRTGVLYPSLSNQVSLHGITTGAFHLVDAGVVRAGSSDQGLPERLLRIGSGIDQLIARLAPSTLALEEAFFGKSVQAALRIGEARGVVLLCAARARVKIAQYSPARVKRSVTGAGAAQKDQVGRWVQHYLGLRAPPTPLDASDALAVALCHAFRLGQPDLLEENS